jgi:hypothetical protein
MNQLDPRFEGALKGLGFMVRDIRQIAPHCPGPDLQSNLRWALRILRSPLEMAKLRKTPAPPPQEPATAPPVAPTPESAAVSTIEALEGAQAPPGPAAAVVPSTSTTPTSAFRPGTRTRVRRIQCEPPRRRERRQAPTPAWVPPTLPSAEEHAAFINRIMKIAERPAPAPAIPAWTSPPWESLEKNIAESQRRLEEQQERVMRMSEAAMGLRSAPYVATPPTPRPAPTRSRQAPGFNILGFLFGHTLQHRVISVGLLLVFTLICCAR